MADHSGLPTAPVLSEVWLYQQVIRCTCGHPENHIDQVCPQGRVEDLGCTVHWQRESRGRRLLRRIMRR